MSGSRILITYATGGGVIGEYASAIAGVLREKHRLEVDVVDPRKDSSLDISQYESVIVGSGVRIGRVCE